MNIIDLQLHRLAILFEMSRERKIIREAQSRINDLRDELHPVDVELKMMDYQA
jgi:hypothetical protein